MTFYKDEMLQGACLKDDCYVGMEVNPELIDDESDFFYDEESFEGCCEDLLDEDVS